MNTTSPHLHTTTQDIQQILVAFNTLPSHQLAKEESFWQEVRNAYKTQGNFINLENGYYGVLPQCILEAQIRHTEQINQANTFFMRTQKDDFLHTLKVKLAPHIGTSPDTIAFARNATDALNIILQGIRLEKGDEIVATTQDYPTALEAIEKKARGVGIVKKLIDLPLLPQNDAQIVQIFADAISPNTKLLLLTHIIHWTGQILPVKEICKMAHAKGVEVLVDSAHAFAQIDFKMDDIGCDYWIANLHKWLGAPLTAGILAIRKDKIHRVQPLLASHQYQEDDIRKFENTSAIPMPIFMTIFDALLFHEALGTANKSARLQYMKNHWLKAVADLPHVVINTPTAEGASCAIANFNIVGKKGTEVAQILFDKFKIYSVGFDMPFVSGVRITPQFYNSLAELDQLVEAIKLLAP
ncbi:MAG: aminotransferase class V-fold PLP-dependent enzyme [Cytophagales bacterium]|nr:MAG: aminotransferase class V-fold PLP-dependent enzyme [Cytophagales bacterium]